MDPWTRAPLAELNLLVPFEQVDRLRADPSDVIQIIEYLEARLDGKPLTKQSLMDSIRRITDLHFESYLKLVKDPQFFNRLVNQPLSVRDRAFSRYAEASKRNRSSQDMFAVALRRRCDDNVNWDSDVMPFLNREEMRVVNLLRSFKVRVDTEVERHTIRYGK